jgi:hypothetical protein
VSGCPFTIDMIDGFGNEMMNRMFIVAMESGVSLNWASALLQSSLYVCRYL